MLRKLLIPETYDDQILQILSSQTNCCSNSETVGEYTATADDNIVSITVVNSEGVSETISLDAYTDVNGLYAAVVKAVRSAGYVQVNDSDEYGDLSAGIKCTISGGDHTITFLGELVLTSLNDAGGASAATAKTTAARLATVTFSVAVSTTPDIIYDTGSAASLTVPATGSAATLDTNIDANAQFDAAGHVESELAIVDNTTTYAVTMVITGDWTLLSIGGAEPTFVSVKKGFIA